MPGHYFPRPKTPLAQRRNPQSDHQAPIKCQKRPNKCQKRPNKFQKRPNKCQKGPNESAQDTLIRTEAPIGRMTWHVSSSSYG